jgi:hypothetical protein
VASIWPSCDIIDGQTEVKITMVVTSVHETTVKKSAFKSSAVSAQEGGRLYWPACWVAYKRKPIVNSATFLERALTSRGALISINQANLSAPLSNERAPLK